MLFHILLAASLVTIATAHQNFHQFWVNGVSPGYQTCIRMPPSNNPVTDVTSNDITCNVNGNIVPSSVSVCGAQAGDTIKVQWDSSTHPGPITHSLFGPVPNAQQATGIGSWAKIDELDYVNGEWANQIMEAQNMTYSFKLPANLASGDYLLRSEMLALHASQTLDGAQFYIGCAQLRITGGPGVGTCSPTFHLPGAYKDTDSDIYIPNFYNGFDPTTYKAPGGPVAVCGGSGGGSVPKSSSTTPAKPPATSTKVATSSSAKPVTLTTTAKAPTSTTLKTLVTPTTSAVAVGTVPKYGQCGGLGWTGATACAAGSMCTVSNAYYSQCL